MDKSDYTVRYAAEDDVYAIQGIMHSAFAGYLEDIKNDYKLHALTETTDDILEDIRKHAVFVAVTTEGKVIGSIRVKKLTDDLAYIYRFGVRSDIKNIGVGSKLLAVACEYCEVNGFKAVEHRDGAFEPHTGVDVFLGEGEERAVRLFVVFHKDVVPDFDILAAVASGGAGLGAGGNVADDKYFGVGSARSGDAGGSPPVVLFGQIENTVACDAVRSPAVGAELVARCVLVAGKDRYRNPSGVDAQDLGQEAIGEVDAFLFEVIAERPVAEHLEEGAVRGVADVVDIAGTDALLDVGKAGALGVLGAEQIGDQGMHPRRRKQDGRSTAGSPGR